MLIQEGFFVNKTSKKVAEGDYQNNNWIEGVRLGKLGKLCDNSHLVPYIENKVEKVAQKSQLSQLKRFLLEKLENQRNNAEKLEEMFGKDQIAKWMQEGTIFEPQPGTYMILS